MIRRPPRSTRTDTLFPTRRSSDLLTGPAFAGATFDAVKAKGFVQCGVNGSVAGFSAPDSQGKWSGIDVDLCHAIAAAMFGDISKVKYTPVTAQQRFVALQSGELDVLTRNETQHLLRHVPPGLRETGNGAVRVTGCK